MNKKGFTLVELMATIAILVLMSVIIGVNITSILRSTEKSEEDFNKEQIEKAACVYVDSDEFCPAKDCDDKVTINKLIETGLLDENVYKNETGNITVTRNDGLKECKYNKS